jgi:spore germination protein YaaH
MKTLLCLLLLSTAAATAQPSSNIKSLIYMQDSANSVKDFLAHRDQIDILVPTWYQVDSSGLVTGEPEPTVLAAALKAHVSVVPIVALFDKDEVHKLLLDPVAQTHMNEALIRECKEHGYDGFQFDLEDIMWTDRDALSATVKATADALHKEHLQVQIAVVPNAPGHAGSGQFARWIFEEWRAAFDLKALGESVDLLCLMTYDQQTRWTSPGPVAAWGWVNENLDYALKVVPREKLSLGIAFYGYHWYTGDPGLGQKEKKPNQTAEYISYANSIYLRDTYKGKQQWDEDDHTPWFYFYRDQMREWVFFTDKRAFDDRYNLAKERHLQGFCAWVLGEEDPTIWSSIPSRKN